VTGPTAEAWATLGASLGAAQPRLLRCCCSACSLVLGPWDAKTRRLSLAALGFSVLFNGFRVEVRPSCCEKLLAQEFAGRGQQQVR
jgi:hypothetical protein